MQELPYKILLFDSNRRPEDAAFLEELQNLQKDNPNYKLIPVMTQIDKSHHRWSGETGYINREMLSRHNGAMSSAVYYIAGPPGMVSGLHAMLNQMGVNEELNEYKKIVREISPLVGDAGVSIEVFADFTTTAESMLEQGREMFSWIPNAYIKFPCTTEGLKAAETAVQERIRVNMTLCFSQQQVAGVYAATKKTKAPVYVSSFVGRLDDIRQNGMDLIKNVKYMLAKGDGHLLVLAASIRSVEQLLYCFLLEADLVTVPAKVLEKWAENKFPMPQGGFVYQAIGRPIAYQELSLDQPWQSYDLRHELTEKGIRKFAEDYRKTFTTL